MQLGNEFYGRNPQLREQAAGIQQGGLGAAWAMLQPPPPDAYYKGDQVRLEEQKEEIEKLKDLTAKMLNTVTSQQARLATMEAEIADYKKLFAKMSDALGTRQDFEDFLEQFVQRRLKES